MDLPGDLLEAGLTGDLLATDLPGDPLKPGDIPGDILAPGDNPRRALPGDFLGEWPSLDPPGDFPTIALVPGDCGLACLSSPLYESFLHPGLPCLLTGLL